MRHLSGKLRALPLVSLLLVLAVVYGPTIQRDVNGSSHPYMIDVGEIQVALNVWGTIHHTGYPLYTMVGALLAAGFRSLGASPALGASLVSFVFGLGAAALLYDLLRRRTAAPVLSASLVLVLGLTQSFWIHTVVAETYSLYILSAIAILWWVLKDDRRWVRRDWLVAAALLGLGIGHHRAVAFLLPALAWRLWPQVKHRGKRFLADVLLGTLVFAATFLVYLYLPIRDWADAYWVYGTPGTWDGFWHEFLGLEARREMEPPLNLCDLGNHVTYVLGVLAEQVTLPGLVVGLATLGPLLARKKAKRFGEMLLLGAASYVAFACWLPEAVLAPAFLMPVPVFILLAVGEVIGLLPTGRLAQASSGAATLVLVGLAVFLGLCNLSFVSGLVADPAGRDLIGKVQRFAPEKLRGRVALLLPWGTQYFALNYGRHVTHEVDGFELVDHRVDIRRDLAAGKRVITMPLTFYHFPRREWRSSLGMTPRLSSVAPGFIEIGVTPPLADADVPAGASRRLGNGISLLSYRLDYVPGADEATLTLFWRADERPADGYSVFVHLAGVEAPTSEDDVVAQFDSAAPVYGLYPTSKWRVGEIVRDDYTLRIPEGLDGPLTVRFGMYLQRPDGAFTNYGETVVPLQ